MLQFPNTKIEAQEYKLLPNYSLCTVNKNAVQKLRSLTKHKKNFNLIHSLTLECNYIKRNVNLIGVIKH